MMHATVAGVEHVAASPSTRGTCPTCAAPVHAKCGRLITWHWAHISQDDCDPWAEPDTEWHREWQSYAPPHRREVVIGPHRADIVTTSGHVVELQHSSISCDEIHERERFYRRMVWIFDATEAYDSWRLDVRKRRGQNWVTFRWKHPRKTVAACRAPVLLDLDGSQLLRVRKFHAEQPFSGWGHHVSAERIRSWLAAERREVA
jgi:competence protein CoiA